MVGPVRERSVYRYFDLADSFVQILVTDSDSLELPDRPGLNRAGYRRMVIQSCMPEFRGNIEEALETLFPEDPLMVEDLLYQLCVEVNPLLDIHEVRLQVQSEMPLAPSPEPHREGCEAHAMEVLLARLRCKAGELEPRLGRSIVGQDRALRAVARAVRKAAVGLGSEGRPLASFLFTGRTGTGKTEMARALARELFDARSDGSGAGLVRIDCSEFALAHEYSKLIGSPPGYVGHEDGGQLTEAVSRNPECVVLFDEIEKAHPRMHNLLLQILEEGALTDSKGRRVSFERAIVILTSNAGAEEMVAAAHPLGFGESRSLDRASLASITETALGRLFSPEFLGRLDQVVLFEELSTRSVERIAAMKLGDLARRTRARGTRVAFTAAVSRWVAEKGYSPEYGARELRRVIQREVEPTITDRMLQGTLAPGQLLRVRVRNGVLHFEVED